MGTTGGWGLGRWSEWGYRAYERMEEDSVECRADGAWVGVKQVL